MGQQNLILLDPEADEWACRACGYRSFSSEAGLLQHCRDSKTHRDTWCERCRRLFVSAEALAAHTTDSRRHRPCPACTYDAESGQDLRTHQAQAHPSHTRRDSGPGDRGGDPGRHRHCCRVCDEVFDTANSLEMHKQTHLRRNKECYGCDRMFAQASAIMIHLESGACQTAVNHVDIDEWAHQCRQHRHYINFGPDGWCFRCPECEVQFERVSGLFQHVESPSCASSYTGAVEKLRRYLERQVHAAMDSDDTDNS